MILATFQTLQNPSIDRTQSVHDFIGESFAPFERSPKRLMLTVGQFAKTSTAKAGASVAVEVLGFVNQLLDIGWDA
jgi:hypothetical protein